MLDSVLHQKTQSRTQERICIDVEKVGGKSIQIVFLVFSNMFCITKSWHELRETTVTEGQKKKIIYTHK